MISKPKQPKAPNPYQVADAQTQSNIATAQEQARLGMTGSTGPQGSVSYVADPNSPSGYRQVTTLDPATQALLDQTNQARSTGIAGATDAAGQPFDLSAATGENIANIQKTFLDPQWEQQQKALESQLANQGIQPGSVQYENAMRQFNNQRQDAYNSAYLSSFNTAQNQAINQRQIPFGEYLSLSGLANPQEPATQSAPQPGVAPTDVTGPVYQSYNAQNQNYMNAMGGIYGLGGALIGAGGQIASNPAALTALGLSDRRLKTDLVEIGRHALGFPVYAFKFIWDAACWHIGVIAQEVAEILPNAVVIDPESQFLAVDYARL